MKKIITVSLLCLLILASCDSDKSNKTETQGVTETKISTEAVTEEITEIKEFVCEFKSGKKITLNKEATGEISSLGEYRDYSEAPSCVHEGSDKVYTYSGFTVMTSPDGNGGEYVYQVSLLSDEDSLANGITIGSPKGDIINAYGDCTDEKFGTMKYELDNVTVSVVIDNGAVSSLTLTAK